MDIQFILEEYSCAIYVVEYVNKMDRGMSNLHRTLIQLREEYPDKNYTELKKDVSLKILNAVEMSSQVVARYLLRQGKSESSRKVEFIPTTWPQERQRVRKTKQQMDEEELAGDSLDVWKEGVVERY
jgi:phosphoribosylanthranilate isomerase